MERTPLYICVVKRGKMPAAAERHMVRLAKAEAEYILHSLGCQ